MAKSPHNSSDWKPVSRGTLAGLALHLRSRRRRALAGRAAAIAALPLVLVAVGGIAMFLTRPAGMVEFDYGGITCTEVRTHLPSYLKGKVPPAVDQKLASHLKQCPNCQSLMRQMGMPLSVNGAADQSLRENSEHARWAVAMPDSGHARSGIARPNAARSDGCPCGDCRANQHSWTLAVLDSLRN